MILSHLMCIITKLLYGENVATFVLQLFYDKNVMFV